MFDEHKVKHLSKRLAQEKSLSEKLSLSLLNNTRAIVNAQSAIARTRLEIEIVENQMARTIQELQDEMAEGHSCV